MAITEQNKQAIDAAVKSLYFVSTDENGIKSIDAFYPDYQDTNEFLLQQAYDLRKAAYEEPACYEPNDALILSVEDLIAEAYDEELYDVEDEILREAGFSRSDDLAEDLLDYLRETYSIAPPFDHYLKQDIKVNLLLDAKDEANEDFVTIAEQNEALCGKLSAVEALSKESGLTLLVKQQGHTMDELQQTMTEYQNAFYGENADHSADYDTRYKNFEKSHNPFLSSVCQELDNMPRFMNCLTILAKVDMYQFAEMMKPGKEITFPKDAMVGFYSPWVGGGSVLEIALEKELTISSEKIWDAQIEGARLGYNYSVNQSYGLIESCWKDVKEIKDTVPEKKPSLDAMIQAAQLKSQSGMGDLGPEVEPQR